jgi:hypothetical protein
MKIIEELEEQKEDYTVEQWVISLMAILTLMWSEVYHNQENKYISFR